MTMLEQFPRGTDDHARSIWSVGARSRPGQRRVRNWPLDDIPLDLPLYDDDFKTGREYPPTRANYREIKLTALRDCYRGDFRHFVEDREAVTVVVNFFNRLAEVVSALLVSTRPPDDIIDQIQAFVIGLLTYGRAYVAQVDEMLLVPEPFNCWRHADDPETLYVVSQWVSKDAQDGSYDRAWVYMIGPDTASITEMALSATTRGRKDFTWGRMLSEPVSVPGRWALADRPPVLDDWGQSAFEQLIPLVVELALRRSGVSYVLAHHENPHLVVPGREADVSRSITLEGQPDSLAATGKSFIQRSVGRMLDNSTLWIPDGITQPTYLTWNGELAASFMQIDGLEQDLSMMTGLVKLLQLDTSSPMSGTAMREQHRELSWTAGGLHPRTKAAFEHVLGETFEWEDALAEMPTDPSPADDSPADDGTEPEMPDEA